MRLACLLLIPAAFAVAQVKITPETTRVRVEIDGHPYTDFFFYGGEAMKPFLWPLRAASWLRGPRSHANIPSNLPLVSRTIIPITAVFGSRTTT